MPLWSAQRRHVTCQSFGSAELWPSTLWVQASSCWKVIFETYPRKAAAVISQRTVSQAPGYSARAAQLGHLSHSNWQISSDRAQQIIPNGRVVVPGVFACSGLFSLAAVAASLRVDACTGG